MISGLEQRQYRSKAWIYYAVITALLAFSSIAGGHFTGLLVAVGTGLYSRYLYRGGRIVIWFF